MTADEFAKIVREGSDKLRVDTIVLNFGGQEFHGSGTMLIGGKSIKLHVELNGGERLPEFHVGIHTKKDTWKLKGIIEYDLEFQCDRAMVASPRDGLGRWGTFDLNPVYLVPSGLDVMSSRELTAFLSQGENEGQPASDGDNAICFTAMIQEYPFYEPLGGRKWEGEIEGFDFTLEKETETADLHVTMNSKNVYISSGQAEDENKFMALMSALAFTTGANAWPYRIEHRRGGKKISDMVRATGKISRISHTPFSNGLAFDAVVGKRKWNCLDVLKKGTAFFETNSTLSKEISNILFLFRQADAEAVHSEITMIALCALFENLVQMLFRELKLEEKAKDEQGGFKDAALQSFVNAKQKLKAEISPQVWKLAREFYKEKNLSEQEPEVGDGSKLFDKAKNEFREEIDRQIADECEGLHRMYRTVDSTGIFSIPKKFQAILNHLQLDEHWRREMKQAFSIWNKARNELFHLKERTTLSEDDQKKDLTDQCQIAAAVNVLILKLIGYSGPMRASTLWGDYQ